MTSQFGFVSAVVSTVLHVTAVAVMSAWPAPESGRLRTNSPRVNVRLVSSQQLHSPAKPAQAAPLNRQRVRPSTLAGASPEIMNAIPLAPVQEQIKSFARPMRNHSESPHADKTVAHSEPFQEAADLLSPCSHLSLPQRWLSIPELFPRRYDIELEIPDGSNSGALKVVSMRPAAEALEYADNVIRNAFELCLAELGLESVQEFGERFFGQRGMTNGLFSVKVEFQSVSKADELRKGI